ncbi:hypothetical protein AKJ16_DCAP03747 [Drosera capensis]
MIYIIGGSKEVRHAGELAARVHHGIHTASAEERDGCIHPITESWFSLPKLTFVWCTQSPRERSPKMLLLGINLVS